MTNTENIKRLLLIAQMAKDETLTPSIVEYATIEACESGAAALCEIAARDNPQPLTLEQVMDRLGETIWIYYPHNKHFKMRKVEGDFNDNMTWNMRDYGIKWWAYDHPPKEEPHEVRTL